MKRKKMVQKSRTTRIGLLIIGFLFLMAFSACGGAAVEPEADTGPATTVNANRATGLEEPDEVDDATEPALEGTVEAAPTAGEVEEGAAETLPAVTPVQVDLGELATESPAESAGEPQEAPRPGIPDPEQAMISRASQELADRLQVDVSDIGVEEVEAVQWSDAALGCPAPDHDYAQVITAGYRIELATGGETFTYHTDRQSMVVLCGADGTPVD